jgi:tripartite-type tricarboxylate transporter receptor subunit TctC
MIGQGNARNSHWVFAIFAISLYLLPTPARAQSDYPNRPVQLIIAYGAGSVGDVSMRVMAERLSAKLGKPFVIDNRPGAAGIVAAKGAAMAAPDGYTLLLTGNSYAISTALFKSLPYNFVTDFVPISTVATFDMLVLTKSGSPFKSMQDVIAFARANPGKLNIATLSAGTTQFLAVELLKVVADVQVTAVPFRTSPDMATALLRGDVDIALEFFAPVQSLIADNKVNVIATTGKKRVYFMPDVPTVAESGLPGFDVSSWNGVVAPKGTPQPIIDTLSGAIIEVLKSPEAQETGRKLGMEMRGSAPADLMARLTGDIAKWSDLAEKAKIPKME